MKKSILVAMILMCSVAYANAIEFLACPVDSTNVVSSYGKYIASNTQAGGYILKRSTVSTLNNITFQGDQAFVKAVNAGTVIYVVPYDYTNGGYFVAIDHGGYFTQYNRVGQPLVAVGDYVAAGQPIGIITKNPCDTSFNFSMTQKNLNSTFELPVAGFNAFPNVFMDATSALKAVCK